MVVSLTPEASPISRSTLTRRISLWLPLPLPLAAFFCSLIPPPFTAGLAASTSPERLTRQTTWHPTCWRTLHVQPDPCAETDRYAAIQPPRVVQPLERLVRSRRSQQPA